MKPWSLERCMDAVLAQEGRSMSAQEMTQALQARGWLPAPLGWVDVHEAMLERYGPQTTWPPTREQAAAAHRPGESTLSRWCIWLAVAALVLGQALVLASPLWVPW